jgi:hypothetical protein
MTKRTRRDFGISWLPMALLAGLFAAACSGGVSASSDAGAAADASPFTDGGARDEADAASSSRCVIASSSVTCVHEVFSLADSVGTRTVAFATPLGAPPPSGWPAVVYFQGSFTPGHGAFAATTAAPTTS